MGEKLTIQERVKLVFMFGKDGSTLGDLKDAIISECKKISTETPNRVKDSFIKRTDACINVDDKQL